MIFYGLVWSKLVLTKKSSKWPRHNQVSWSSSGPTPSPIYRPKKIWIVLVWPPQNMTTKKNNKKDFKDTTIEIKIKIQITRPWCRPLVLFCFFPFLSVSSSFIPFPPFIPVYSLNFIPGVWNWLPWPWFTLFSAF